MTELKLDPRNARRHSPKNKAQIKQSLETVGAGRSILADADGIVRAGNGVFAEWGDKPIKIVETDGKELVVVQRTDLRGQEAIRAAALDNLVADSSAFDYDAAILAEIARDDDVIRAIANEDAKLRELLRKENGNGEKVDAGELIDKAAQLQEKWQVNRGDVWQVGNHRLMCGDSTSKEDVERLMDGKRAQVGIFDPPYGMDLDTDWSGIEGSLRSLGAKNHTRGNKYEKVVGDDKPFDPAPTFDLFGDCKELFLFGADYYAERIPNRADGSWLVWDKRKESQADAIGAEFELIWSKQKHKRRILRHDWFGFLSSQNGKDARNRVHPTQKPVSLIADIINQWSDENAIAFDGYLGSGTLIVACEQTGRIGYGMEIEPRYCAVSLERLANLGLQPQRLSDG